MRREGRLSDYIKPGVRVLFVGINPGRRSAEVGHHFAGYSNRFWKLLYNAKLVPIPLTYQDDWRLPEWGFGITNIVSRSTPGSSTIKLMEYRDGRKRLLAKIRRYRPHVIALLGMTIYPVLFPPDPQTSLQKKHPRQLVRPGLQSHAYQGSKVFLLPNPSGRNAHYSYQEMLKLFRRLRNVIE